MARLLITTAKLAWSLAFAAFPAFLLIYAINHRSFDPIFFVVAALFLAGAALPWATPQHNVTEYRSTVAAAIGGLVLGFGCVIVAAEIYSGGINMPAECSNARSRAAIGCSVLMALYPIIGKLGVAIIFLVGAGFIFWGSYALFKTRRNLA
jgi:hypothetical protein